MKQKIFSIPSPFAGIAEVYKYSWEGTGSTESLSIVSGLHGDQLNGLYISTRLIRFLNTVDNGQESDYRLQGKVQLFPVVNPNAVESGTRCWTFDDLDMDLAFPGNDKGEIVEQLASTLVKQTSDSTYGLILLSGPVHYEDAPHIQSFQPDRWLRKLARGTGLPVVREREPTPALKLQLFYQWVESGVLSLVLSAGKSHTIDRAACDALFEGILRFMVTAGLLTHKGSTEKKEKSETRFYGAREELPIRTRAGGLFLTSAHAGDRVKQGEKLGELRDVFSGETLEEYTVPEDGFLVSLRDFPVVYENEPVAILLPEKKRPGFWPFST